MPPLKSLAAAATSSKACFINVPRIDGTCSYRNFLRILLREKHSKKQFLRSEKETVDHCFRLQATQHFKLDNDKLRRAIAEPDRDDSFYAWKSSMTATQKAFPKASAEKDAGQLEGLSLPILTFANQGTENRDLWKELSYTHLQC
ncbi:hypothetical protein Q7P35_000423 [Cladosporium inversicolor]